MHYSENFLFARLLIHIFPTLQVSKFVEPFHAPDAGDIFFTRIWHCFIYFWLERALLHFCSETLLQNKFCDFLSSAYRSLSPLVVSIYHGLKRQVLSLSGQV